MLATCFGQIEFICKCHLWKVIHFPLPTQRENVASQENPGQMTRTQAWVLPLGVNHWDYLLRYPKRASCLARNQEFGDRKNRRAEEKQLQRQTPLSEKWASGWTNTWKVGGQARPWQHQNWPLPSSGLSPCILTSHAPHHHLRLTLSLFSGTFLSHSH